MKIVNDFKEYKILDMSSREKLELWNGVKLQRPDPQIIWDKIRDDDLWDEIDAIYSRSNTGGGSWSINNKKL